MPKKVLYTYIILVLLYAGLTFFAPTEAKTLERYDLTYGQLRLLSLTILLPLIGIWFAAFYGYGRFKRYADKIRESKDGQAFAHIANGLGVLALSLVVPTILSAAFRYVTHQSPDMLPVSTIITNYVTLVFSLVAFLLIYKGSRALVSFAKIKEKRPRLYLLVGFGLLAVLYTYFALANPYRQTTLGEVERAAYYLPDMLILLTIIVPYLFAWFFGLRAVANIQSYKTKAGGLVYERTLSYLATGIAGVILMSILLQFLRAMTATFSKLSLAPILIIVYLLLFAIAVGYVYIALGAKRLQKIEEV